MKKTLLSLLWLFPFSTCLLGSELDLVIRDKNTHAEIENVSVFLEGTTRGTTSDHAGKLRLNIDGFVPGAVVVFSHVSYERAEFPVSDLANATVVFLQPRVISMRAVEVEGEHLDIEKELAHTITTIEARRFESRGYVDAGDLLRLDHSLQVDESLSGKKTVSIRGGNSDDVIVLYNGIKMNNAFNNIFDMSLIDLADLKRLEIVKGANTSLYGSEALSGVVNVVPRMHQTYTVRFQQRLGSYRAGNWGLHLHRAFNHVSATYSVKQGAARREFSSTNPGESPFLRNELLHHTATFSYEPSAAGQESGRRFNSVWTYTESDYRNERDDNTLDRTNNLISLGYSGDILGLDKVELTGSFQGLQESQEFIDSDASISRGIDNKTRQLGFRKELRFLGTDFLAGYQFQSASLQYENHLSGGIEGAIVRESDFVRQGHGFVLISRLRGATGSTFYPTFDVDVSLRHDIILDRQGKASFYTPDGVDDSNQTVGNFNDNDWRDTVVKMSLKLEGENENLFTRSYLTFGNNVKFPTLFQQISPLVQLPASDSVPRLSPEESQSLEMAFEAGRDIRDDSSVYGWLWSSTFFQTYYNNKFREFSAFDVPVVFYDNVPTAKISGFESKGTVFLMKKKIGFELGVSRYFLSDRAAFPFKSDFKLTTSLLVDHAGYSMQLSFFKESAQAGWLRQSDSPFFAQVELPAQSNMDVHLSKTVNFRAMEFLVNFSGRNILKNNEKGLVGLTTRDRRFYITFSAQI
jgi:outer membrane cobalamin receptor